MKKDEYKCDLCKGVFTKAWSNKGALVEMERDFGTIPKKERVTVCDDCYKKVMGYYTPWINNESINTK